MSDTIEQRRYSRSPISMSVQVRLETGVLVEGCARNVSLNGLFFETERTLPLKSRVKVKMAIGRGSGNTSIIFSGIVARLDELGVAIELDKIDEDSMVCLCGLIRETAEDAVRLEEEIERRLGTGPTVASRGKEAS